MKNLTERKEQHDKWVHNHNKMKKNNTMRRKKAK
jgi:hypothetical protein